MTFARCRRCVTAAKRSRPRCETTPTAGPARCSITPHFACVLGGACSQSGVDGAALSAALWAQHVPAQDAASARSRTCCSLRLVRDESVCASTWRCSRRVVPCDTAAAHQSGWMASRSRRSYTSRTTASNADTSNPVEEGSGIRVRLRLRDRPRTRDHARHTGSATRSRRASPRAASRPRERAADSSATASSPTAKSTPEKVSPRSNASPWRL